MRESLDDVGRRLGRSVLSLCGQTDIGRSVRRWGQSSSKLIISRRTDTNPLTYPSFMLDFPLTVFRSTLAKSDFLDFRFDSSFRSDSLELLVELSHEDRFDLGVSMNESEQFGEMRDGESDLWSRGAGFGEQGGSWRGSVARGCRGDWNWSCTCSRSSGLCCCCV